jgi:NMD protein affecting ribosome stability and mRNA decay
VSRCKACGESYRKGKRRVVLNVDGSLSVELVCPECVRRSVSIVTRFARSNPPLQGDLLMRVSDRLRTHLHAANMQHNENDAAAAFTQGRISALQSAIELIQRAIVGVEP